MGGEVVLGQGRRTLLIPRGREKQNAVTGRDVAMLNQDFFVALIRFERRQSLLPHFILLLESRELQLFAVYLLLHPATFRMHEVNHRPQQ